MRPIPATVTNPKTLEQLNALNLQIEAKMVQVNQIRDTMKKKDLTALQLQNLKQVSTEIHELDLQWKSLT